jgi:hypothetical protein
MIAKFYFVFVSISKIAPPSVQMLEQVRIVRSPQARIN